MAWNETYNSTLGGLAGSLLSNATQASNGVTNSANALAGMIQARAQHDFENGLKLAALDDAHKADYEKKLKDTSNALAYRAISGMDPNKVLELQDQGISVEDYIGSQLPFATFSSSGASTGDKALDAVLGIGSKGVDFNNVLDNLKNKADTQRALNIAAAMSDHKMHPLDEIRGKVLGAKNLTEGEFYQITEGDKGIYTNNSTNYIQQLIADGRAKDLTPLSVDDLVNTIYNKATEEGYGVTKDSIIKAINTNKLTNNGVQQILKDSGSKLFRDKLDQLLKASVDNPDGFDYGGKSIFDLVETDPSINAMLLVASPEVKEAFYAAKEQYAKGFAAQKADTTSILNQVSGNAVETVKSQADRDIQSINADREKAALNFSTDWMNRHQISATNSLAQTYHSLAQSLSSVDINGSAVSDQTKAMLRYGSQITGGGFDDLIQLANSGKLSDQQVQAALRANAILVSGGNHDNAGRLMYLMNNMTNASTSKEFKEAEKEYLDGQLDDKTLIHNINDIHSYYADYSNNNPIQGYLDASDKKISALKLQRDSTVNAIQNNVYAAIASGKYTTDQIQSSIGQIVNKSAQAPQKNFDTLMQLINNDYEVQRAKASVDEPIKPIPATNSDTWSWQPLDWLSRLSEDMFGSEESGNTGTNKAGSMLGALGGWAASENLARRIHNNGKSWYGKAARGFGKRTFLYPLLMAAGGIAGGEISNRAFPGSSRYSQELKARMDAINNMRNKSYSEKADLVEQLYEVAASNGANAAILSTLKQNINYLRGKKESK